MTFSSFAAAAKPVLKYEERVNHHRGNQSPLRNRKGGKLHHISTLTLQTLASSYRHRCSQPPRPSTTTMSEDEQKAARTFNRILAHQSKSISSSSSANSSQSQSTIKLSDHLREREQESHRNAPSERQVDEGLKKLRRLILVEGIPCSVDSTIRPRIWKILLGIGAHDLSADRYLRYVGRGPCEFKEKIRNDTFR